MNSNLRPSGIEAFGDTAWGTHFCLFYETKEDLLNILIPYFRTGLEKHESCLWVTPEPLSPEEAKRTVREAGPEFERHLADGQIEIVSYMDWYLAEGRFDIQRVLQDWIDKHDQAIAKGYAGLRCTGNTFWLKKHQWDSFAKYEVEIDKVVSKLQIIVLCTYSLEHRSARDVLDVVHQHQFTIAKRNGVWEHLEGSELKRAHDEIRQLNADLERRVVERTAQLATANEQLKLEISARKAVEESLQEAQARTESVLASVADTHILLDRQWKYIYVNEAAIRAIGRPREQILGRTLWELYPDIVGTELDFQYRRAMDERLAVVFDFHYETLDTWWANRFYPTPEGLAIFGTDITERKQAEAAIRSLLQISEKLHATLDIDALLDSLVIEAMKLIDAEIGWSGLRTEEGMVCHTHITRDLQVVPFKYFWPPGVGLPGWVLVHKVPYVMNDAQSDKMIIPEIRERFGVKAAIDTPILDAQGEVIGFFEVINKKNGAGFSESDVEKLVAVSRIASIALQNAMSYANLERAEEALRESQLRLQQLSRQLLQVQESERRALTTELHDRVGQNLTGLSIILQNMKALLSEETAQTLAGKFDDAQTLLEDITRQIRDIMAELHLPELEEYGLAAALEIYAERAASRGKLELIADLTDLTPPRLPSNVRIALFRSAQEAIINVLRHADATQLAVSLHRENGRVRLRVEDDGRGFDPNVASQKEAPSWGLKIMRERIESIGGKVQIESEPGHGTRVTFEIERPS